MYITHKVIYFLQTMQKNISPWGISPRFAEAFRQLLILVVRYFLLGCRCSFSNIMGVKLFVEYAECQWRIHFRLGSDCRAIQPIISDTLHYNYHNNEINRTSQKSSVGICHR